MSKDTKIIVGVILAVAILLVAVGYAAISAIPLKIEGTATGTASQENFKVTFTGTPTVSAADKVTAEISKTDPKSATMVVTGLTAKGDKATATYTITNGSADLSAALSATTTCSNQEYFKVTQSIAKSTIAKGTSTEITVTVELIKTPIEADQNATIGVSISADPQQPAA